MTSLKYILALATVLCGAAEASDVIKLKEEAFVKGPMMTLGEIADIEGDNADFLSTVEIGTAAAPGVSKRIDATMLEARVRTTTKSDIDFSIAGAAAVRATTLHTEIPSEMIADDLRRFIESEMPWNPAEAEISVTPPAQNLMLPQGDIEFQWQPATNYRYLGITSFRGSLLVDGEVKKTFLCKAQVESYGDVIVAASNIARGVPVSLTDIQVERRPLSTLKDTGFTDPAELTPCITTKPIMAGQVIPRSSVQARTAIAKRQLVTVETRAGGLAIRTQAQALTDAAVGEAVTCINPSSKETRQTFVGIVRADGTVVVQ